MQQRYLRSFSGLGSAIRDYRLGANLTQAELATKAGVSRGWLNTVENGAPNASAALIWQVLTALGIDVILTPAPPPDDTLAKILGEQP